MIFKILLFSILIFTFCLPSVAQETIYDIQYTPDPYGDSPYEGQTVTVTGIVTASAKGYDLGFVFIQDEGGGPWSGIWINGLGIEELYRKEEVTVTGVVSENFGFTMINNVTYELTGALKEITSTDVDPSDSSAYEQNGWEKWESVLVKYKAPNENKLYISHPNANLPNNYGDYAVSPKSKKVAKKLGLILAGRITSSIFSSLYVQIISDSVWWDNSGQMQVNPIETSTEMEMDAVIGIMAYGFSDYRLLPRNNDDFVNINVELDPTFLPPSPLGIDELADEEPFVHPNPAKEFININSENEFSEATIFNQEGQKIRHYEQLDNTSQIDISDLKNGTFILRLKTRDGELRIAKFVVQ